MHPYSGGSKLASVSPGPVPQKGVQNEAREMFQRGEVEATSKRAHHLNVEGVDRKQSPKKNQVLRVSAFSVGLVYGSWKLSSLKSTAAKAAAEKEKAASHGGGH